MGISVSPLWNSRDKFERSLDEIMTEVAKLGPRLFAPSKPRRGSAAAAGTSGDPADLEQPDSFLDGERRQTARQRGATPVPAAPQARIMGWGNDGDSDELSPEERQRREPAAGVLGGGLTDEIAKRDPVEFAKWLETPAGSRGVPKGAGLSSIALRERLLAGRGDAEHRERHRAG